MTIYHVAKSKPDAPVVLCGGKHTKPSNKFYQGCGGTGVYWKAHINGVCRCGLCFRCRGKGWLTKADYERNMDYDKIH